MSHFLHIRTISDRYEVVGSSLRRGDVRTSPHKGGCNKHKSRPGQRNPPASASLWRWQGGGFFARGTICAYCIPPREDWFAKSRDEDSNPRPRTSRKFSECTKRWRLTVLKHSWISRPEPFSVPGVEKDLIFIIYIVAIMKSRSEMGDDVTRRHRKRHDSNCERLPKKSCPHIKLFSSGGGVDYIVGMGIGNKYIYFRPIFYDFDGENSESSLHHGVS